MIDAKSGVSFVGRRKLYRRDVTFSNGNNDNVDPGKTGLAYFDLRSITADVALRSMLQGGAVGERGQELWAYFDIGTTTTYNVTLTHAYASAGNGRKLYCPYRFYSGGRDIVFHASSWVHFIYMYDSVLDEDFWFVTNISGD